MTTPPDPPADPPPVVFVGDVATVRTGEDISVATLADGTLHITTTLDPLNLAAVLRRAADQIVEAW